MKRLEQGCGDTQLQGRDGRWGVALRVLARCFGMSFETVGHR
jgi:hypothetical protein